MHWLIDTLRAHPELSLFFTLGVGFWLGDKKFRGFSLGAVTSVLLVGVIVGQLKINISTDVKSVFFLMFLFAVGFGVGPQFFRGLKKDGLPQVLFSVIIVVLCLLCTWGAAVIMGYSAGESAGLLSGANTISAVIGVSTNTINSLSIPASQKAEMINAIPVSYAVTYIFGTLGAILLISKLAPFLLGGIDNVKKQCKELEASLGGDIATGEGGVFPANDRVLYNCYEITGNSIATGKKVSDLEKLLEAKGHRLFVERIRQHGQIAYVNKDTVIAEKNIVVIGGRKEFLLGEESVLGKEVYDVDLLNFPVEKLSVLITSKQIAGKTLVELREKDFMHGIAINSIKRLGIEVPVLKKTKLDRGDTIELSGLKKDVEKAIPHIGDVDRPTDKMDMVLAGLGIFLGGLLGAATLHIGKVPLSLTTSGGALIGGLIFGWIHSRHPNIGAIPQPTLWFMNKVGLCTFIAIVGIMSGPSFISGFQKVGPMLFAVGAIVTIIPIVIGIFLGRYVFKFHPALTLGALSGSRVCTAALGAAQDTVDSKTPALGYTVTYAVGNTLLIICGVIIVLLTK
ncbi:MAG: aspartate-alanine antiporter [Mucilaginibacter sp.]